MPSIPQQFDFVSGVALNSLTSITKEQIIQAINQIAPLSNIGGIVVLNSGGLASAYPTVIDNPRFSRYIWIDPYYADSGANPKIPPRIQAYDQSGADGADHWIDIGLSADSVKNSHIDVGAVSLYDDAVGNIKKISLFNDDSINGAWRGYLVRVDTTGQRLEAGSISTVLPTGSIPVASIVPGSSNQILRTIGGVSTWTTIDFAAELNPGSVLLTQISGTGGAAGYLIRVSTTGALEAVNNNDSAITGGFLPVTSISPTKIASGGASAGWILRWSGAYWEAVEPPVGFTSDKQISTVGIISEGNYVRKAQADDYVATFTHELGEIPKIVRVVFVMKSSKFGYAVNDEIDHNTIVTEEGNPLWSIRADSSKIVVYSKHSSKRMIRADGHGAAPILGEFDDTDLICKCYAWA